MSRRGSVPFRDVMGIDSQFASGGRVRRVSVRKSVRKVRKACGEVEEGRIARRTGQVLAQSGIPHRKALSAVRRLGYSVHIKSAAKAANARRNPWIQFMHSMKGVSRPAGMSQRAWMQQLSAEYRSGR